MRVKDPSRRLLAMSLFKGIEFDEATRRQLAVALIVLSALVVAAILGAAVFLALKYPWLLLVPVAVAALAVLLRLARRAFSRESPG